MKLISCVWSLFLSFLHSPLQKTALLFLIANFFFELFFNQFSWTDCIISVMNVDAVLKTFILDLSKTIGDKQHMWRHLTVLPKLWKLNSPWWIVWWQNQVHDSNELVEMIFECIISLVNRVHWKWQKFIKKRQNRYSLRERAPAK